MMVCHKLKEKEGKRVETEKRFPESPLPWIQALYGPDKPENNQKKSGFQIGPVEPMDNRTGY